MLAPSRADWLAVVEEVAGGSGRRSHWRRGLLAACWQLAVRTDEYLVTTPAKGATWAEMAAAAHLSRSCFAEKLAWLRGQDLLHVVMTGSIPRTRPGTCFGMYDDGLGNLAAEYALVLPAPLAPEEPVPEEPLPDSAVVVTDEMTPWPEGATLLRPRLTVVSETAGQSPVGESRTPHSPTLPLANPDPTRARELTESDSTPQLAWPLDQTPRSRADRLLLCARLQAEDERLARVSARHLRSLLRPLLIHGASARDVEYALTWTPEQTRFPRTEDPRYLPGWIRHRVAAWVGEDGALRAPLPSQARAAAAARRHEEQQRRRAERAALQERRVDVRAQAARARAALAAASPAAAKTLALRSSAPSGRPADPPWSPEPHARARADELLSAG
ncbi:hypothetical protein [Bailinhaonella thermotolerans]|uniref:Uncharacterized protein n=1 Tax=Bailinhaonella thermotolerans TaxID=1070861 RepID=A0A3A4A5T3_9ACTN|nr:hypothetical protein [Bailinhaonella thermotolerans]RJL21023.1 hypothetical protein D5H75_38055 [Bailinhaonella thermotolerans]